MVYFKENFGKSKLIYMGDDVEEDDSMDVI